LYIDSVNFTMKLKMCFDIEFKMVSTRKGGNCDALQVETARHRAGRSLRGQNYTKFGKKHRTEVISS